MSKHFWRLKEDNLTPHVKWQIIRTSSTPINFKSKCPLCLEEKIEIVRFKDRGELLNSRNELVFKCRHKSKYKLV